MISMVQCSPPCHAGNRHPPLSLGVAGADAPAIQSEIEVARRKLDLPDMDYEQTLKTKLDIARRVFDAAYPQLLVSRCGMAWAL